ncbi:MAG: L,D-transpeptidase [Legionellaceae bacterium]|nr:L,D-transpeptidase [Legionellaceae bacterium]
MSDDELSEQTIRIHSKEQIMHCYQYEQLIRSYSVSTGKNGLGEIAGSECTPRGWHAIYSIIGQENDENSVFVSRQWTGERYTPELAAQFPNRDWILTRILQLDGLEEGRNKGNNVDSLSRYIYIHGTPETTLLGVPGSRGCVRMRNADIIELANWVQIGTKVYID